ncbi:hypothetical protein CesoFtcFv8_009106 [Champsocephalus esox]|uniref:Uncharacterized protein n=1 Tax=Champsocephalus esox TaxID=159716 RepID=A0AAN8H2J7_9TELE|nr:hypothetical protein CesoFtcFv8_009106 [Champsocephalus esox]
MRVGVRRSVWRPSPWVASRAAAAGALAGLVTMTTENISRACAPALRVFLRVAACGSDGQMAEQADQQRTHPAVRLSPPHSSMGYRKHSCPPRSYVLRANPSRWNSC